MHLVALGQKKLTFLVQPCHLKLLRCASLAPSLSHTTAKLQKPPPKTSAVKLKTQHGHNNLTLSDWLTVVAYHDQHQPISQADVIKHFANKEDGALIFDQSSLSRHLSEKGHKEDAKWLKSNPTALSSKWMWVVTRPDVQEALFKWVMHMETKGEQVSGPMVMAKREKFEVALGVPEDERLKSMGWVKNFCKT